MRRTRLETGSFIMGVVIGIALVILVAFAVSSNSVLQFNSSGRSSTGPSPLQRQKSGSSGTSLTINIRQDWDQFVKAVAAIPQAVVNWFRSQVHIDIKAPSLGIKPASP